MIQLRIHGTPLCLTSEYNGPSENVTAELRKYEDDYPKNTTTGPCDRRISVFANVSLVDKRSKKFYVNYTYTSSMKTIIKKIPRDCESKFSGKDPIKGLYFVCDFKNFYQNSTKTPRKNRTKAATTETPVHTLNPNCMKCYFVP